jgi:hypothetical protein
VPELERAHDLAALAAINAAREKLTARISVKVGKDETDLFAGEVLRRVEPPVAKIKPRLKPPTPQENQPEAENDLLP